MNKPHRKVSPPPAEADIPSTAEPVAAPAPAPQRHEMVAEAAYFRALDRGFSGSPECAVDDWLWAEAEIDARLAAAGATPCSAPTSPSDRTAA